MQYFARDKNTDRIRLDDYTCDLNLEITNNGYSCYPLCNDGFSYMWAGAKSNYGIRSGKACYEVKITEYCDVLNKEISDTHVCRFGWSTDIATLQLGEDKNSFGFGGTGKKSLNRKFLNYGRRFERGDVIGCYLAIENGWVDISYSVNGRYCGSAFKIRWMTDEALYPHILTKNSKLDINFGQALHPYFSLQPGYKLLDHFAPEALVSSVRPPSSQKECEIIMMVGLPGVGKSTWAINYAKLHPSKKYVVLGTDSIIDKMRIMGVPRKFNYGGRWELLIKQATECFNILLKKASGLPRNLILDQTNVYDTARIRKVNQYRDKGYTICAMVLVPRDEDMINRSKQRTIEEGKEVPDVAVLDMKANFSLPEEDENLFDSITFLELQRPEAQRLVEQYNMEAMKKGHRSNQQMGTGANKNQTERKRTLYQNQLNNSRQISNSPQKKEDRGNNQNPRYQPYKGVKKPDFSSGSREKYNRGEDHKTDDWNNQSNMTSQSRFSPQQNIKHEPPHKPNFSTSTQQARFSSPYNQDRNKSQNFRDYDQYDNMSSQNSSMSSQHDSYIPSNQRNEEYYKKERKQSMEIFESKWAKKQNFSGSMKQENEDNWNKDQNNYNKQPNDNYKSYNNYKENSPQRQEDVNRKPFYQPQENDGRIYPYRDRQDQKTHGDNYNRFDNPPNTNQTYNEPQFDNTRNGPLFNQPRPMNTQEMQYNKEPPFQQNQFNNPNNQYGNKGDMGFNRNNSFQQSQDNYGYDNNVQQNNPSFDGNMQQPNFANQDNMAPIPNMPPRMNMPPNINMPQFGNQNMPPQQTLGRNQNNQQLNRPRFQQEDFQDNQQNFNFQDGNRSIRPPFNMGNNTRPTMGNNFSNGPNFSQSNPDQFGENNFNQPQGYNEQFQNPNAQNFEPNLQNQINNSDNRSYNSSINTQNKDPYKSSKNFDDNYQNYRNDKNFSSGPRNSDREKFRDRQNSRNADRSDSKNSDRKDSDKTRSKSPYQRRQRSPDRKKSRRSPDRRSPRRNSSRSDDRNSKRNDRSSSRNNSRRGERNDDRSTRNENRSDTRYNSRNNDKTGGRENDRNRDRKQEDDNNSYSRDRNRNNPRSNNQRQSSSRGNESDQDRHDSNYESGSNNKNSMFQDQQKLVEEWEVEQVGLGNLNDQEREALTELAAVDFDQLKASLVTLKKSQEYGDEPFGNEQSWEEGNEEYDANMEENTGMDFNSYDHGLMLQPMRPRFRPPGMRRPMFRGGYRGVRPRGGPMRPMRPRFSPLLDESGSPIKKGLLDTPSDAPADDINTPDENTPIQDMSPMQRFPGAPRGRGAWGPRMPPGFSGMRPPRMRFRGRFPPPGMRPIMMRMRGRPMRPRMPSTQ